MEYETYQTTTSMSAAEAAVFGSVFLVFGSIMLILVIVMIVAMWKIFAKAGEPGWKAIVPIYNSWVFLKLGNQAGWWALVALIPLVNIVAVVFLAIAAYNIGLKLGKQGWWVILYILVPFIWALILAFDSSKWQGNAPGVIANPVGDQPSTPLETAQDSDEVTRETKPPVQL